MCRSGGAEGAVVEEEKCGEYHCEGVGGQDHCLEVMLHKQV